MLGVQLADVFDLTWLGSVARKVMGAFQDRVQILMHLASPEVVTHVMNWYSSQYCACTDKLAIRCDLYAICMCIFVGVTQLNCIGETVEPPITDSLRYGLPPYNGQTMCPRLTLP